MHSLFEYQHVYFYPERIFGVNFNGYEVWPMRFDTPDYTLDMCSECEPLQAEFYSVFIIIPGKGRDCIADCATKELAEQLQKTLSLVGEMYIRQD